MQSTNLKVVSTQIRDILIETKAPANAVWKRILGVIGLTISDLASLDFESESQLLIKQVKNILILEPAPVDISFLYFGLFELLDRTRDTSSRARVGFYFAGGTAPKPEVALDRGDLSYLPNERFLQSRILNRIRELGSDDVESRQIFDYAILLGAAGVLAKSVGANIGINVPTYVGFDSGDYALVSRGHDE
ncbi:MAG TPA: hypothetical protein VF133_00510 [Terriglobales bacterium]